MQRKKRSDRNHLIYCLLNRETGEKYVGVTQGSNQKSLHTRVKQHIYRAYIAECNWKLYQNIRQYGLECFDMMILTVVRGKTEVHAKEREIIGMFAPELNTK